MTHEGWAVTSFVPVPGAQCEGLFDKGSIYSVLGLFAGVNLIRILGILFAQSFHITRGTQLYAAAAFRVKTACRPANLPVGDSAQVERRRARGPVLVNRTNPRVSITERVFSWEVAA